MTMTWGGVGAGMLLCDKSSVVLCSPAWLGLGGRLPTRVAILCSASKPNRSTMLETIVGPRINQTLKVRTSTIVKKTMPWTWPGRKLMFNTPRFRVEPYLTQAILGFGETFNRGIPEDLSHYGFSLISALSRIIAILLSGKEAVNSEAEFTIRLRSQWRLGILGSYFLCWNQPVQVSLLGEIRSSREKPCANSN